MQIRKSTELSDKYRGGSFRFLKIQECENDEGRSTVRESRIDLIKTEKKLEEQLQCSFKLPIRLCWRGRGNQTKIH